MSTNQGDVGSPRDPSVLGPSVRGWHESEAREHGSEVLAASMEVSPPY